MPAGRIIKALSGFYYVSCEDTVIRCRARGIFRKREMSPLVGDFVEFDMPDGSGDGSITEILPRKNSFVRPSCANIDDLVIVAAAVNPVTDPFLIDRMTSVAENSQCAPVICINKCDLDRGDRLYDIYKFTGYPVVRTSAVTGEGIEELRSILKGRVCAFSGNSGVGKSSILNALDAHLTIAVGEVSQKLGRGRHTTRHVELFKLGEDTYLADTPGFASFDVERFEPIRKEQLQFVFPEFDPYIGTCRFSDCAHISEPDCSVIQAVKDGTISTSRYESYKKLYEQAAMVKDWQREE